MAFAHQFELHNAFGACMFLLLAIMLLVGVVNRFLVFLGTRRRLDVESGEGGHMVISSGSLWPRAYTWYRGNVGVPAAFGYRHVQPWGFLSIPTRVQTILIGAYIALNVVFSVISYELFDENMYWWHQKDMQLVRYVSDRTGVMSFWNLVLIWLLAGRNDVVMWITGWSFRE